MFPIDKETLEMTIARLGIVDISSATIRQICALAAALEQEVGEDFVHLEIGNPGLPAEAIGVEAECEVLRRGIANQYPNIAGLPALKDAASDFIKAFLNINIPGRCIVPTVGSMQGSFTMMLLLGQRIPGRDTILYIDPGFPAQRSQSKVLGLGSASFDIYDYRGKALEGKLDEMLSAGNVTAILYSNPNNPSWINFTEEELEIIGRMATKHDVIVIEDHAYLGMDFRTDFGHPGEPPYIPTVARYTDNYILLLSASKIFSYAGQRIAVVAMGEKVFDREYPYLQSFYEMPTFGDAYIFGVLYTASSGTAHSAQHAMAAMMRAAVDGRLNFVDNCSEYGRRGEIARRLFTDNGFHLIYSHDGDCEISNGFFFTVGYGEMKGDELQKELLRYGISSIPLHSTGSWQEGLRICVSMLADEDDIDRLSSRLAAFDRDFSAKRG